MKAADIKSWDALARTGFTYLADPPSRDTWRSHAAEARAGHAYAGDCDDLCSTALELLIDAGLPLDHAFRIVANAGGNPDGDHLAGMAQADDGSLWIVGDTFGASYPAGVQSWAPIRYQRMDEGPINVWRDGAPWSGGER